MTDYQTLLLIVFVLCFVSTEVYRRLKNKKVAYMIKNSDETPAKNPHLFYYEEGLDSWVLIDDDNLAQNILPVDSLDNNEEVVLKFKRLDLTDEEYANLINL